MTEQLQLRRGAAAQVAGFVAAAGEIVIDSTSNRAVVGDGATPGGWPAAKLSEVVTNARVAVADANYAALATDRSIAFTALTAARVVALPAAATYPTGTRLAVFDESGACSATNLITVAAAGSDLIDGAMTAILSAPYGYLAVQSNGAGKWTIVDQASTNLAAVAIGTNFDANNALSVSGASALFNGASFNVTVNKSAAANTASFIFEDAWSGRAQIGLCGDDNFHFKVSPNGSSWSDALTLTAATGAATFAGAALSKGAGGIGYATGAGGTATQSTSKATAVTLNAPVGQITMNAASLAAGAIVSFALTNSAIAAGDLLLLNHVADGTAGAYGLNAQCGAGAATINVRNATAGALAEAIVVAFALVKGATS